MNPNKIDMTLERTKEQWQVLLDCVKTNDNNILSKEEQSYYIDEIIYKITGSRHSKIEVLKDIEASMPDYGDIL